MLGNQALRLTLGEECDWLDKEIARLLFIGELEKTERPVRLCGYMGGRPMDFLWTGFTPLVCISKRVVALLEEHQFTGWSTYPVEVYDRKGQYLPDYFGFAITGKAGERDRSRSEIITRPPPAPAGKPYQVYKGLFFNEQEWDGSDFFVLANSYWKIVSQPVWQVFKRNKVNNVRLIRLTEVEIPLSIDNV